MIPFVDEPAWVTVLYFVVAFLVGARLSTAVAWKRVLKHDPDATELSSADWWREPDAFCMFIGCLFAWPAVILWKVLNRPLWTICFRPPASVRERIAAARIAELERELDLDAGSSVAFHDDIA